MKTCSNPTCSQVNPQPLDNFYKEFKRNGRAGMWYSSKCKTCKDAALIARRHANPEQYNKYMRDRRLDPAVKAKESEYDKSRYADPTSARNAYSKEKRRKQRESGYDLMYNYGITKEQRQQMVDDQNGCCAICGKHESTLKRGLFVDHVDGTKIVRGMLCDADNKMLGLVDHDITVLEKAIEYLKGHGLKIVA